MNAGTPTYATQKPCHAPITAPMARPNTMAAGQGRSHSVIDLATRMPVKAATEPTERSMCPATITMSMPMARIRMYEFCWNSAIRLSDRSVSPSVQIWKIKTIATRVKIIPNWRALEVVPPNRFF